MFKAEVREQFERVTEMLNQLLLGRNVNNNGAQAMEPLVPANDQDIIILGGRYSPAQKELTNTVEKFNIEEGKSTDLPRMNQPRVGSASCIYNDQGRSKSVNLGGGGYIHIFVLCPTNFF